MDRYDPDRQPSIFKRPFDESDVAPGTIPAQHASPQRHSPRSAAPRPRPEPPRRGWDRRRIMGVGAPGILAMLLVGIWLGSALRANGDQAGAASTATPSPTATAIAAPPSTPTPSAEPTLAATASPLPTPTPTPAGPPEQLVLGGWARVAIGELNVRADPGVSANTGYRLVRGAVARVFEGPVARDGFDWYRIGSLGGARGWVASGPAASPFISTFARDDYLVICDRVTSEVLRIVDGSVQTVDPIAIGELALPAAAFDTLELAALELVRGARGNACFAAQAGRDEALTVTVDLQGDACGRPVAAGGAWELRPAPGQHVGIESQVKQTAVIHPAALRPDSGSGPLANNLQRAVELVAAIEGGTLCLNAHVTDDPPNRGHGLWASACVVVAGHDDAGVTLRTMSGGTTYRLLRTANWYVDGIVPGPDRTMVHLNVARWGDDRSTHISAMPWAEC